MNEIQRIPLVVPIAARDGVLCADAKIQNGFIETPDDQEIFAVKRNGFTTQATLSGTSIGQGIFGFGANQYAIFDDIIYRNNAGGLTLTAPVVADLIFRFEGGPPASGLTGFFLKSTRAAYFYDTSALTVTKVTDVDYPSITVPGVAWLNGRFFVCNQNGQIFNSAINNPFDWSALAVIGAIMDGDSPVTLTRFRNYIMVLKDFSIEFFNDTGSPPPASPLLRVDSAFVEIGCAAAESVINTYSSVFFVGQVKRTKGRKVYMMEGYIPQIISNDFIEKILDGDNLSNVRAFGYSPSGKDFYVLQLFNSERTLVYDIGNRLWYVWGSKALRTANTVLSITFSNNSGVEFVATVIELGHPHEDGDLVIISGADIDTYNGTFPIRYLTANSYEYVLPIDPLNDPTGTITAQGFTLESFRPSGYATAANVEYFQDRVNGKIYTAANSDLTDDNLHIDWRVVTQNKDFETTNTKFYARVEPVGDKTLNSSKLYIRHSDTDYRSFSPFRSVDLNVERSQLRALGSSRRRAFELRHHGQAKIRLSGLEVEFRQDGLT